MRTPKTLKGLLMAGMVGLAASLFPMKANAQTITYYPSLDSKVQVFRQPNQSSKPLVWDTLSTRDQILNQFNPTIIENKTDTITHVRDGGSFESADFALQLHMDYYGRSGFNFSPEDTVTFSKFDTTNNGKFNIPLYYVSVSAPNFGHAMNWFFGENNLAEGDTNITSPLDFYDGVFVEPQTDSVNVKPKDPWPIPKNCTLTIYQSHFHTNENNKNRVRNEPFLKFFLKDGKVDSVWYDPKLVLSRNPPTQGAVISPAEGEILPSGLENVVLKINPSIDPDGNSATNYLRVYGPELDTIYTPTSDSIKIPRSRLKDDSEYNAEGWSKSMGDSVAFLTNPRKFKTPKITGIERINEKEIPDKYLLSQNYPNPFNPSTKIRYSIPKTTEVSLKVYNVLGREIETLVDGVLQAGEYNTDFSSSKLSSGVYFYRLNAGDFVQTKKMVVVK